MVWLVNLNVEEYSHTGKSHESTIKKYSVVRLIHDSTTMGNLDIGRTRQTIMLQSKHRLVVQGKQ